jgi:regulator of protease activity HflC (stomatin/prohibitin superfamily)
MLWILAGLVSFLVAAFGPLFLGREQALGWLVRGLGIVLGLFFLFLTSYVHVDADKVGHLKRIYLAANMSSGQIVALPGQKGPQAEILGPGFHFIPLVRVLNDFEEFPKVIVPEGQYGFVVAKDGRPLGGEYMASEWPAAEFTKYLDAAYFLAVLEDGLPRGCKGPQLTVLPPGEYRLNLYLFDVDVTGQALDIPAGFVGVVKSNVGTAYAGEPIVPPSIVSAFMEAYRIEALAASRQAIDEMKTLRGLPATAKTGQLSEAEAKKLALGALSVPIVPRGYKGVWQEVLNPDRYYLNSRAYQVDLFDTRIQTWEYKGGFKHRWIDLEIDSEGRLVQKQREADVPLIPGTADSATILRIEGWEVYLESRILVQVTPENAPFVKATVGGIDEVENKVITPTYKSVSRNVLGNEGRRVLDILYHRDLLEDAVEAAIIPEGLKAGLIIREVRFGDPAVPPELLIPGKRTQLASQLKDTYKKEEEAQKARIDVERVRAQADKQGDLMAAEIAKQAAEQTKEQQRLLGEGEKLRLQAVAEGQKAQQEVFGMEKTFELAVMQMALDAAVRNSGIVKVPGVLVMGQGSGLEGAAAILGASNLSSALSKSAAPAPKPAPAAAPEATPAP